MATKAISLIFIPPCYIILRNVPNWHLANRPLNWYVSCNSLNKWHASKVTIAIVILYRTTITRVPKGICLWQHCTVVIQLRFIYVSRTDVTPDGLIENANECLHYGTRVSFSGSPVAWGCLKLSWATWFQHPNYQHLWQFSFPSEEKGYSGLTLG